MKNFFTLIILFLVIISISSCKKNNEPSGESLSQEIHKFKNYSFNPDGSILSRVKEAPRLVLNYLKELDGRKDYINYSPDTKEMRIIEIYITLLPQLNNSVLKSRLLGIYFIKNLLGSGLTEWASDDNGNQYIFMAFNPITLKKDLSQWITYRENSCFINDSKDISLSIDCGEKYTGFLYVFLHESTHAADYVKRVTPFVEEALKKDGTATGFTDKIWKGYNMPVDAYEFKQRKDFTFYGFNKGPKIKNSLLPEVYEKLMGTPFVSLYGSVSWAEDIADYVFFYYLTSKLNQPYKIIIKKNKKKLLDYEPMKNPIVKNRILTLKGFY